MKKKCPAHHSRELVQSPHTCPYCPCYYNRKPWEEGRGGLHGQRDWGRRWRRRRRLHEEVQGQLARSLPFARTQLGPSLQLGARGRLHRFQPGVCGSQHVRLWAPLPLPLVAEEPSVSGAAELQAGHPARRRWVRDGRSRLLSILLEQVVIASAHAVCFSGLSVGVGLLTSFLYVNKSIQRQVFLQVCPKQSTTNCFVLIHFQTTGNILDYISSSFAYKDPNRLFFEIPVALFCETNPSLLVLILRNATQSCSVCGCYCSWPLPPSCYTTHFSPRHFTIGKSQSFVSYQSASIFFKFV